MADDMKIVEGKEFTHYKTSDIYFAAYLSALDIPLESTEHEENGDSKRKKVIFIFKVPVKDLQHLKSSFFGGTGTVLANKFVQAIRSLKQLVYI